MTLVETLDANAYIDPLQYERERQAVFRSAWVLAAYTYQFTSPGDYVTEVVADWPIFIQLGDDGELRAFHNVCPHRAGPIMWDGAGCQANLVCRYHGWVFAKDGSLRNARDFGAEDVGLANPDLGLTPIRVGSWRGFVFVCMDPSTADLVEWLGGFPAECDDYPIESYEFHTRSVRPMACNWKTYADNFLEGYHVPIVHPLLARDIEALKHRVITKGDRRWNIHIAPQRVEDPAFTGVFFYFWPNFSLNIFPGGFATERWLPRGPHRSELVFEYFFTPGHPEADEIVKVSEEVALEDLTIAESVQRNLHAGIYRKGLLSPRHENGLADFKELLTEVLAGSPLLP